MRPRLSYANVMSTLCFFLLLGGGAYAARQLPKNSVGSPQIKKNAVKTGDIARNAVKVGKLAKEAVKAGKLARNAVPTDRLRNDAVTGAKVREATLGTVPTANAATTASVAGVATSLSPTEAWHEVGAPGEPGFLYSWANYGGKELQSAGFYKDHEGNVHLKGYVTKGGSPSSVVFSLPPGYRPAGGKFVSAVISCSGGACGAGNLGRANIFGTGVEGVDGGVAVDAEIATLDGISFRAES